MTNFQVLCKEIMALSRSSVWDVAKTEWSVIDMEQADEPETCLCGHYPIVEVFTLANKYTGDTVRVGNVCVNKFIRKNNAFNGYKKILKTITASATIDLIKFALDKHIITTKDYNFYINIMRKRVLSELQYNWKVDINIKIVNYLKRTNKK